MDGKSSNYTQNIWKPYSCEYYMTRNIQTPYHTKPRCPSCPESNADDILIKLKSLQIDTSDITTIELLNLVCFVYSVMRIAIEIYDSSDTKTAGDNENETDQIP